MSFIKPGQSAFLSTLIALAPLCFLLHTPDHAAMPDFRHLPLSQLILYCPSLLQAATVENRSAWVELYRRALVEQNQAAWDALMMRLWPAILYWIYSRAPEVSPSTAERFAQQTISEFQRQQAAPTADSPLLTYDQLLMNLQRLIAQLLEE